MKKCASTQSIERKNSDHCVVSEFPIKDSDINFAVSKISARYPENGRATNTHCKELVYISEGNGKIVVDGIEYTLTAGDVVIVEPNEKFYWDGNMTLHISCTPAFYPDQHIHIE